MPVSEQDLDAVWDAPAPTASAGGTLDKVWEDDDADFDKEIGFAFKNAFHGEPDRKASILELSRQTGVPSNLVEANFDGFAASREAAATDPRKWRQENPGLAELVRQNRKLAEVVVRDEQLSPLTKGLRAIGKAADYFIQAQGYGEMQRMPGGKPDIKPPDVPEFFPAPKQQAMETDPSASGDTGAKVAAAFEHSGAQSKYSELGFRMLAQEAMGKDVWDLEKEAVDLERNLAPRFYGAGPGEQILVDAAEMLPSMIQTYAGAGAGGAVGATAGAAVGGGIGFLVGGPAGAAVGAKKGALGGLAVGARAGGAARSFQLEAGGAYLDMLKEKTDDGRPVDRSIARGASLAYGAVAASIEAVSFGVELSAFGPLGDAIRNGSGKAFMKGLLKNAGARQLFADIGKRWAKGAVGEGAEEFSQQIAQDLSTYLARSATAGAFQEGDVRASIERGIDAAGKAMAGAGAMAPGQAAVGLATHLGQAIAQRDASVRSAPKAAAITQALAESPTARASPDAVAQLIERESASGGEPISSVFVDPAAVVRYFQENQADPDTAAQELMGAEGRARVREAIATGQKLEVPLAEYAEKWARNPINERLAEDIAVRAGHLTARELAQEDDSVQARAKDLAAQYEKENTEPTSAAEKRLVDAVQDHLVRTGVTDEKQSKTLVSAWRAFIRTQAERIGKNPDELFEGYTVRVRGEGQKDAAVPGTESLSMEAKAKIDDALAGDKKAVEELAAGRYADPLTPAGNKAAWEDFKSRPRAGVHVSIDLNDFKAVNDQFGHDVGDKAITSAGGVFAAASQANQGKLFRPGGDEFRAHFATRAQAEAFLKQSQEGFAALAPVSGEHRLSFSAGFAGAAETSDVVAGKAKEAKKAKHGDVRTGTAKPGHGESFTAWDEGPITEEEAPTRMEQPAFHGSPHRFEKFSLHKIGTGEGAQAYGWGLYFAGGREVAEHYRKELSPQFISVDGKQIDEMSDVEREAAHYVRIAMDNMGMGRLSIKEALKRARVTLRKQVDHWNNVIAENAEKTKRELAEFVLGDQFAVRLERSKAAAALADEWTPEQLSQKGGVLYEVEVPDDAELLDYDVPIDQQPAIIAALGRMPEEVRESIQAYLDERGITVDLEELNGRELYQALTKYASESPLIEGTADISEQEQASRFLGSLGIPGLRYLDGPSRKKGEGTHNYVVWDEGRVQVKETYYQGGDDEKARGYVEWMKEGAQRLFKVVLNKNADVSTFLHESGHIFLEMMGDFSARADTPQRVKEDYAATLKWLGVEKREDIKVEQHEKWARAFEAYLYEGKAPSAALSRAFARFRAWLMSVYREVSSLGADLNDDIRGVFDRLLATDAEIERARRAMGLEPMFRSAQEAAAAGLSAEDYQAYLDSFEKATAHAEQVARLRVLKDRLRESETWWKGELAELRDQAEAEFELLAPNRAAHFLRSGEWKDAEGGVVSKGEAPRLDREAVAYALGREPGKAIAGFLKKGGLQPDDVAEMFGFGTGRELLEAIERMPEKATWSAERAAETMREKHPGILDDIEKLRAEVGKGLHGDYTQDVFLRELKVLGAKGGAGRGEAQATKVAARQIVERKNIGALHPGRILQAERSAAEKAARAAATGNLQQAYAFKLQQLLNHYLYREVTKALEERESMEDLASNLSKDKARAKLGKASPAYRDAVDAVLEALGLKRVTEREEPLQGLPALVTTMEANGETVAFDVDAVGKLLAQPKHWKQLTVAEMRNVVGALKNIRHAAANRNTSLVDGRRVDREEVIGRLVAEATTNLPAMPPVASSVAAMNAVQGGLSFFSGSDGSLLRPETMLGWLGGGLDSTWHKAIFEPLNQGKYRESEIMRATIKPIMDALDAMPDQVRRHLTDKVDGAKLFPGHRQDIQAPTRRFELLAMALNAGNESNLQRLLGGRGIQPHELQEAIDLLSKEEMDWVQACLDAAESLWPMTKELEERDTGLAPEKIDSTPIAHAYKVNMPDGSTMTQHTLYRGGYWPAVYDRRVATTGERQAANTVAALMDPSYTRPGTARSHTKKRADEFADVIALDLSVLQAHLVQVAHDVAFREAIKSVGGLILAPEVQAALKQHLGDERAKLFLQWVKDVGQMRGAEVVTHATTITRFLNARKANMSVAILGYAVDVVMGDISNPLVALSATDLKAKHLAAGMGEFLRSPRESLAFVHEKSKELRFRDDSMTREFATRMKSLTKPGGVVSDGYDAFVAHAFTVFEWSEKVSTAGIWIGAFRQAVQAEKVEADAVAFADSIVRKVVPANSAVDKSDILRSKGVVGALLMFHGYMNTVYNLLRDVSHPLYLAAARGETSKEKVGNVMGEMLPVSAKLLGIIVAVGLVSEFFSGKGPEPEDGDDELERWVNWAIRKSWMTPMNAIPFAGPAVELWSGKSTSVRAAPAFGFMVEIAKAIKKAGSGDASAWDKAVALAKAAGSWKGAPVVRPLRTADYIHDLVFGETEARNPADVVGGTIYGQRENQPLNPASAIGNAISGPR